MAGRPEPVQPRPENSQVIPCHVPLSSSVLFELSFSLCPWPDDSWLEITAEDLDHMLQERPGWRADVGSHNPSSGKHPQRLEGTEERKGERERTEEEGCGYSLVAVSQGMKKFLDAVSSHEGAEVPW